MRAAFFDLDKTIIAKPSVVALSGPLRARGFINKRVVARAIWGQLLFLSFGADDNKMEKIRRDMLKISAGWPADDVRQIVDDTIHDVIEPLIFDEALELIDFHRSQGDEVWIVSSSPEEIVEPFAALVGATGAIASRALVDEDNCYTGELEFFCQGPNKAAAMRELADERGIDLSESSAYSDSETDVPMFEAVGHPYAVNPDRELRAIAHARGWPTLVFAKPVRPGTRQRPKAPFIVGLVALAAVALLRRRRSAPPSA